MEMSIQSIELKKILLDSGIIPKNVNIDGISRTSNGIKLYLSQQLPEKE